MEAFLQKFFSKLKWLNIGTGRLQAEFASHLGWSLAVPLLVYWIGGAHAMNWGLGAWAGYSIYKELISDGHLKRILAGQKDDTHDMWTDLLARLLPVAVMTIVQILRGTRSA